jgi:hypothetical protein
MALPLKQEIDTLLHKEMDRKTFVKHIAFAVAMLTGVGAFIKLVSAMNRGTLNLAENSPQTVATGRRSGYGRIGYGTKLEGDA